jgi:hypothetical protein
MAQPNFVFINKEMTHETRKILSTPSVLSSSDVAAKMNRQFFPHTHAELAATALSRFCWEPMRWGQLYFLRRCLKIFFSCRFKYLIVNFIILFAHASISHKSFCIMDSNSAQHYVEIKYISVLINLPKNDLFIFILIDKKKKLQV